MNYIVWQKAEYEDAWRRTDCESEAELQAVILDLIKQPGQVEVTVPVQYTVKVSLSKVPAEIVLEKEPKPKGLEKITKEELESATKEGGPAQDKDTKR